MLHWRAEYSYAVHQNRETIWIRYRQLLCVIFSFRNHFKNVSWYCALTTTKKKNQEVVVRIWCNFLDTRVYSRMTPPRYRRHVTTLIAITGSCTGLDTAEQTKHMCLCPCSIQQWLSTPDTTCLCSNAISVCFFSQWMWMLTCKYFCVVLD